MKNNKYTIKNRWTIGNYKNGYGNPLIYKNKIVAYLNYQGWIICDVASSNLFGQGKINIRPSEIEKY